MIFQIHGIAWIILNWKLKVFFRPKANTPLIVKTWVHSEDPLFFYRDFEIINETNNIIAKASSKWVLFDVNKNGITKIPLEARKKYTYANQFAFQEKWNEKLKEPKDSIFIMDYKIQRRDIDTNNHVNNLYYLDYANEVLPEEIYNNSKFSNVEIMYKLEAKLGETITLFYSESEDNSCIITIKDDEKKKIHAIVKLFN